MHILTMLSSVQILLILATFVSVAISANDERVLNNRVDLTAAASERSFNYFTKSPSYPYPQPTPYPNYPTSPSYPYPTRYPNYYPSTSWNNYSPNSYYPTNYLPPNRYPGNKFDYWFNKMPGYPNYPNYPNNNGWNPNYPGYYPNGGTNMIGSRPPGFGFGNGGYGGYQGNGGLLSYSGYNGYYANGNYPGNVGFGYQNSRTTGSTPTQEFTPRYPAVVTPSTVSRDA